MRDPKRIDLMLDRLRILWKVNPDLRLAQIIGNAFPAQCVDPYFIEDEEFIEALELSHRPLS